MRVYSDGRVAYALHSVSGVSVQGKDGNVTRPERTNYGTYVFPERDSWQISELADYLSSKPARELPQYVEPPHRPIDFLETTTVKWALEDGRTKQVQAREYYVASLKEKAK